MVISTGYLTDTVNGIKIDSSVKCNSANYTNCASRDVKYVIIHYTANVKDSSWNNAKYFNSASRGASAHFFVDEKEMRQSVELRDKAWHVGCSLGYKTACTNTNSVGIEMCTSGNYTVSDTTQKNTAYLCAHLCKLVGIKASQVDTYVLRHYDVVKSNKMCPKQFVEHADQWTRFKTWVKNILETGNIDGKKATTSTTKTTSATTSTSSVTKIKEWQKSMNISFKGTLKEDGKFTADWSAFANKNSISAGSKRTNIIKWLQKQLGITVDGSFGAGTKNAVVKFQKAHGLTTDGIVGLNTYKALIGVK